MHIFKKIFAGKEVKLALAALRLAESKFDDSSFVVVKEAAERIILTSQDNVIEAISVNKLAPIHFVCQIIQNIAAGGLSSGRYHIYRGVLNSRGHSLLRICDIATDLLVTDGDYTSEQAEEDKAWIREQIAVVG